MSDQLHLHEGGLRLDAVFTDVSTKYSVSVLLLLFLPQYLSSVQYFMTNANDKGKFFELLLKVLTEFIVPMTGNLNQCDTIHCRLLLFAVAWIDAFVTMPLASMASMNPRFNVLTGIKIAATMDVPTIFESDHENSSLEVDIQLKKCIHILSGKIPENHPDHNVRKLRWSCMAKSVFRSSTAEIRELASDRPNDLSNDTPMRRAKTDDFRTQSYFIWLLETCFVDNDRHFREDVCHNFCRLILSNNDSYLLSHFASEKDSQILATFSRSTILGKASSQVYEVEHAAESVVSEFFRDIDKLLHTSIGVSDSQLSFTMANSGSTDISTKGKESQGNKQSMKRTALKLLATFCRRANTGTPMGRFLFEKSLQRLARIWAAANYDKVDDLSFSTSKVLAFAELSRISAQQIEGRSVWWDESPHFTATIFSDILVLNCNASREMQCLQLEGFIRTVITRDPKDPLVNHRMLKACQGFVEESLPAIVAQFIEEKSLELLRLTPAFRQFLEERIRRVRKDSSGEPRVIGGSNAPDRWKYRSVVTSIGELDKQARKLCLDHRILDRVLPMVFLSMDRTGLSFLTKEVLKGMTLTSLIKTREIMILKGLVWELGQEPESFSPARIAIRTVAAALTLDDAGGTLDIEAHRSAAADVELGKKWVTSHFMYLLVSVVQSRWKARSLRDRLHAVKCLHGMLDFLVACEAPQYFPQIMTTVNASILGGGWGNWSNDQDMLDASSLRLYAIKSLSKLIRLVAEVQLDTIAVNLTTIVVALIPVVDDDSQSYLARYDCAETRDVAVSILNFLTAGDLGCSMAVHFKEIPFLPSSQSLESVHRSLLSNGVDFDNLAILSSMSASQHGSGAKRNFPLASEFSATMGNTVSRETEKILALQNRLSLICGLLESESTSVRKVSLEHLIDLLRGNRDTFRMLVIAEGSMSEKRFLTLAYKGDGLNRKCKSTMSLF